MLGWWPCERGQPLPLRPAGSVPIGPAAALLEDYEGGVVFVWGMASWCWPSGDVVSRRLAAVGLVATGAATRTEVAAGFGVDFDTVRRWSRAWEAGGAAALAEGQRGPKGPSKLTTDLVGQIRALRRGGASLRAIASEVGVSTDSVRVALAGAPATGTTSGPGNGASPKGKALEPLARPEPREKERELASAGMLAGAPPVICEGASLPLLGALLVLPALALTGLLGAAEKVLGLPKAAFYSLHSLLLALVFLSLLGEPRAEGASRVDPVAIGRLLGLDRGPEVKTLRRRMGALAGLRRSNQLLGPWPATTSPPTPRPWGWATWTATSAPTTAAPTCHGRTWPGPGSPWPPRPTAGWPTRRATPCWCGPRPRAPRLPAS